MSGTIINCDTIISLDNELGVLRNGAVCFERDTITDVGDSAELKKEYPDCDVVNLKNSILTPGLINIHHHLYSSFARGWNPAVAPSNFPQILEQIWWRLDENLTEDDIYYSALTGLIDSIRCGVTNVVDHHSSQGLIDGSLELLENAFKQIGVRGSICFEISDRLGKQKFIKGLNENIRTIKRLNKENGLLTGMCGMHASFTLSDESLDRIAADSADLNCGYHFHLLEDISDREISEKVFGSSPMERFSKFQMLNEKSIVVHGVHLNEAEYHILRDSDIALAHCPRSNMNNAVGNAILPDLIKENLNVGIGTDGMDSDVLADTTTAMYLAKHSTSDFNTGFNEASDALLKSNGEIFKRITNQKVGKIKTGYKADFVLWDYNPPSEITDDNYAGHILFGLSNSPVDSVWINGRRLLVEGQFLTIDENQIRSRCRELSKELWKRL
ncbi:MAG: putative aminohydrolase SsnA [candidate division Zixibacteria bacterium]|nr:putative aminohydrolase SsnA [candidate division Zixibacteria bacterium]